MDVSSKSLRLITGHLSDDCWYLIFKKLDLKQDQDSFGLTCRSFLDIQNSSVKHLELGCWIQSKCSCSPIDPFTIQKLLIRFRELDSLSLGSCNIQVSDSSLIPLLTNGSKLRYLWLDFCRDITAIGFTLVASGCPLLSVISLCRCSITDSGLEILANSCSSLKEINIFGCENITDRGILSLNKNCRRLRTLKLSHCPNITGVGFQGCSRTMACLEADHCAFDSTGVAEILSGGGLQYLNISYPLKHTRAHGLTLIGLGVGANIEVLNLSYCKLIEDATIIVISKGCPILQEWNLSYCSKIGISGWESIGLYCQSLEVLNVNHCDNLCDKGFLALGNGCKSLSKIYIDWCQAKLPQIYSLLTLLRKDLSILASNPPGCTSTRMTAICRLNRCFSIY